MKINLDIPGQISEQELSFLARIAARVPPGGRVMELGALFGRSSWTWAQNIDPTATLYCIDPWKREPWIAALERQFGATFGLESFHSNTADCTNIVALPGYSPDDCHDWNLPLDVFFDDSVHTNPVFRSNLEFWLPRVKPGGIMCGHDYSPQFPDVVSEVRALADRLGTRLEVVGTVWMLEVPEGFATIEEPPPPPLASSPLAIADDPRVPDHIGTMMKPDELRLLFTLARDLYEGRGEIVDLGPFLGSSTIAFAEGLRANPRRFGRRKRIYSYDRFLYQPWQGFEHYLRRDHLPTDSFFMNFFHNTKEYHENIFVSPGDLLTFRWNQAPIEILFIDAAKSAELNDHIDIQFFSAVMGAHGVVVQQDYFYFGTPWIIEAMAHFSPWLAYVGAAPGATAYFQSRAAIPRIASRTPLGVASNPARRARMLERALACHDGNRRSILELSFANWLDRMGRHDAALERLQAVERGAVEADEWRDALVWNLSRGRHALATAAATIR